MERSGSWDVWHGCVNVYYRPFWVFTQRLNRIAPAGNGVEEELERACAVHGAARGTE